MDFEILKYVLVIAFSVLGIMKNSIGFKNGFPQFVCSNYVLNTYLYLVLSWGIILSTVVSLNKFKVPLNTLFSGPVTIMLFLTSIVMIIGLTIMPPKYFLTKHVMYLFEIAILGVFLYPMYVNNKSLFNHVGLTTLIVLIGLSVISYYNQDLIKESWGYYLFFALVVLLIARCVEMFLLYNQSIDRSSKLISYVAIGLFALYIMYDTKKVIVNSKNCVNPDYIRESLNLFLDSLNMFTNIYHVRDN
jgi:FtsH-binding integral membrane protein